MSTTPAPVATTTFWQRLKQVLPAIEMAGNVALLASPFAGFEPLVAGLEKAAQSAIEAASTPQTFASALMYIYAAMIGVLTTLKAQTGLAPDLIAKIDGYIVGAQNATAAFVQAESGFDASLYTPVQPIV